MTPATGHLRRLAVRAVGATDRTSSPAPRTGPDQYLAWFAARAATAARPPTPPLVAEAPDTAPQLAPRVTADPVQVVEEVRPDGPGPTQPPAEPALASLRSPQPDQAPTTLRPQPVRSQAIQDLPSPKRPPAPPAQAKPASLNASLTPGQPELAASHASPAPAQAEPLHASPVPAQAEPAAPHATPAPAEHSILTPPAPTRPANAVPPLPRDPPRPAAEQTPRRLSVSPRRAPSLPPSPPPVQPVVVRIGRVELIVPPAATPAAAPASPPAPPPAPVAHPDLLAAHRGWPG